MIPAEAVEAAAQVLLGYTGGCVCHEGYTGRNLIDPGCRYHDVPPEVAKEILEAAAPYMMAHEREQTRLAHLDAMVNRETASRLEQAIAGVLELAAHQRHMVSAAEIREWIANALEGER